MRLKRFGACSRPCKKSAKAQPSGLKKLFAARLCSEKVVKGTPKRDDEHQNSGRFAQQRTVQNSTIPLFCLAGAISP